LVLAACNQGAVSQTAARPFDDRVTLTPAAAAQSVPAHPAKLKAAKGIGA
jgi:hypothetical protein